MTGSVYGRGSLFSGLGSLRSAPLPKGVRPPREPSRPIITLLACPDPECDAPINEQCVNKKTRQPTRAIHIARRRIAERMRNQNPS